MLAVPEFHFKWKVLMFDITISDAWRLEIWEFSIANGLSCLHRKQKMSSKIKTSHEAGSRLRRWKRLLPSLLTSYHRSYPNVELILLINWQTWRSWFFALAVPVERNWIVGLGSSEGRPIRLLNLALSRESSAVLQQIWESVSCHARLSILNKCRRFLSALDLWRIGGHDNLVCPATKWEYQQSIASFRGWSWLDDCLSQ